MKSPKVFGIGFHKTATSSLAAALDRLGYTVCGHVGVSRPDIAEVVEKLALSQIDQYDAFQDNPWPLLFRELDNHCPGSKFILTTRPTEEWIRSVVRHFGGTSTPMREWIYGVGDPQGNEEIYVERYERHNREVKQYFSGRPDDFLELCITEGEGWKMLCPFLNCEVPSELFPHTNKGNVRTLRRLYQRGPSWLQELFRSMRDTIR
jgi:hypothetical protein